MSAVMRLERNALSLILVMTFLSLSLSETSLANPTCYYPDGSIAQSDLPCGNSTDVACCGGSAICLTNGLCLDVSQPNTLARSSCTDKTWTSGNCPNYCLQKSGFNHSGCSIILSSYINSKAEYCCNNMDAANNTPICAFNLPTFEIPNSDFISGYAGLSSYTNVSSTSSSTSSAVPSATSSAPSNTASCANNNNHVAIGVGVGLGVPLGLIALVSIAWALWERRKLNRYLEAQEANAKVSSSSHPNHLQSYSVAPMDERSYAQPTQTYNQQPNTALYSEMETRGPVELDIVKK